MQGTKIRAAARRVNLRWVNQRSGARMLATAQVTGGGVMGWVQPSRLHSRPDRGPNPAGGPQGSEADV